MADFTLIASDAEPALSVTLTNADGSPQNLSPANGVDRVDLRMCLNEATTILPTTITDALNGKVRVDFPLAGLPAGLYSVSWVVVFDDGRTKTAQRNSSGDFYTIDVERRRC